MSLMYYDIYMDELAMSPNDDYRNDMQAFINAQWDNATTMFSVNEETEVGTFTFNPIEVHINHVINESTTGRKNGNDFRKLIFQELTHRSVRGRIYQFDNNYWITTYTDDYDSIVNSIIVRRCNNIAKYMDTITGEIIEVPCILDYTATSPSPKYSEDIVTPDNHVILIVQGNTKTIPWKQNQRFIFNGRPFKITGFNNYMQNSYVDQNTTLLYFDLYLDEIQPGDDIINNIANRYDYDYTVNILQKNFSALKGDTGKLTAEVKLNGVVVKRDIIWSCNPSSNAIINDLGEYTILSDAGTEVEFMASTGQYNQVQGTITCQVVDSLPQVKTLVIDPVLDSVPQGQSRTFSVNIFSDGIKQSTEINYATSGASPNNYIINRNGNEFTLTNLKMTTVPLLIMFSADNIIETLEVKLKSAF